MKKLVSLSVLLYVLSIHQSCKKTGGGNPNPGGGGKHEKKWLIKSVIGKYDATKFQHTVVKYDDTGRILQIGYGLSGIKDTFDLSVQTFVDYTYDSATGRVKFMKPNQAPGYNFTYVTPFSIQMTPQPYNPKQDPLGTFNFNGHGRNELDERISFIPPGNLFAGTEVHNYIYNDVGGLQGESNTDDKGVTQDLWTFVSPGPAKSIPNPFVGTSIEQRLVYFASRFGLLNSYDMLGSTWSNGVMESYSYNTGVKKPFSRFTNEYILDANGRVIKVTPAAKIDPPNFGMDWIHYDPYYITYEQH